MTGTVTASVIFVIFVVVIYLQVFRLLKRESAADEPV